MDSEAKQTETSIWRRKRFIPGPSKEDGWLVLKNLQLFNSFQGGVFIGTIWGDGGRVCGFPLIGWWWGTRVVLQDRVLSLKLAVSFCVGPLVPAEELEDIVMFIPWGGTRILSSLLHYSFLIVCPLFLHFLTSLISSCLNLLFGIQESPGGLSLFLKIRNRGTQKNFVSGRAHRVLLGFNFRILFSISSF